ncbi:MAG: DUF3391 domain-containing protein [Rhodocyclaceae bacterium]|nr:MAG: DUF3391 domain-containing protein [Rhodocyclaceae bacterium]
MLKKINTAQMRLGMPIHELCGPWIRHPFRRTKSVFSNRKDLGVLTAGQNDFFLRDQEPRRHISLAFEA